MKGNKVDRFNEVILILIKLINYYPLRYLHWYFIVAIIITAADNFFFFFLILLFIDVVVVGIEIDFKRKWIIIVINH